MSSKFRFDELAKEKYRQILRQKGPQVALTLLHQDLINLEYQSFEGEKGYQPEMWASLDEVRSFSREIWELATLGELAPSEPKVE